MSPLIMTLTQVDSSAKFKIGQRYADEKGNVYLYLQGIASVVTGDFVTYRLTSETAAVTARASSGSKGLLAIALAATIASTYGWFQVAGSNLAAGAISGGDAAAGAPVFLTSTAGLVDDVEVADDRVSGATFSVQEDSALAGVTLDFPFVEGRAVRPILTQIDDSALRPVGDRWQDAAGNVFVYLSGVASCIEGSWCTYYITSSAASVTALFAASSKGLIAIAMAALVSGKFGWFQIAGNNLRARATTGGDAAAGAFVYYQAAGICDDQLVAGDMVYGAIWSIQEGELSGNPAALAGVTIQYPFVTNEST